MEELISYLTKIVPPAILFGFVVLWLLLRYWSKLKRMSIDLRYLHSWIQEKRELFAVNRGFRRSFNYEQPLFRGIEDSVVILQFKVDPKHKGRLELKGKTKAIAFIPKLNAPNIIKWTRKHLHLHVMPMFFIKDLQDLRKATELAYLKMIIDELGFDGAYSVALHKALQREFKRPHIERLFNALTRINEEMKSKHWIDKNFMRIILIETFNMELKLGSL